MDERSVSVNWRLSKLGIRSLQTWRRQEIGGVCVKPRNLYWQLTTCTDICRLEGQVRECLRYSWLLRSSVKTRPYFIMTRLGVRLMASENEWWLIRSKRKRVDVCQLLLHVIASSICPLIASLLAKYPNLVSYFVDIPFMGETHWAPRQTRLCEFCIR